MLDTTGPVHWACAVAPLDQVGYVAALTGRLELYALSKGPGGSLRGRGVSPGVVVPAWSPQGVQDGVERLHVGHPCPVKDQRPVNVTVGPPKAPATPGAPADGFRPQAAHVYGASSSKAAEPANHHLSSAYPVCGTCRRNIKHGELFTGIQHGAVWKMAEHEKCDS